MFKNFIFDVDGVFTDGKFHYSADGKVLKVFGDADNDALSLIRGLLHVEMITGDKRGFSITKKRIEEDMGYPLSLVSTFERVEWMMERFNLDETIYMGDGLYDPLVFANVAYSIAPANAFLHTKKYAKFVTHSRGGEGAVAEAIIHVLENLFNRPFDILTYSIPHKSGNWEKKK
ncbi:MAG: hypothetical protein ACKO1T_03405 [Sediminibacterium sp.]